jgi:hypothetical protein
MLNGTSSSLSAYRGNGFFVSPINLVNTNLSYLLGYDASNNEIVQVTKSFLPVNNYTLYGQTLSSIVMQTWTNGNSLTIPSNKRFNVTVMIGTNYTGQWVGCCISLYTSSRYYGLTYGNPTTTNNYVTTICNPITSSSSSSGIQGTLSVTDIFDLSSDASTSVNVSFYFKDYDNTNINITYSVILTPI